MCHSIALPMIDSFPKTHCILRTSIVAQKLHCRRCLAFIPPVATRFFAQNVAIRREAWIKGLVEFRKVREYPFVIRPVKSLCTHRSIRDRSEHFRSIVPRRVHQRRHLNRFQPICRTRLRHRVDCIRLVNFSHWLICIAPEQSCSFSQNFRLMISLAAVSHIPSIALSLLRVARRQAGTPLGTRQVLTELLAITLVSLIFPLTSGATAKAV